MQLACLFLFSAGILLAGVLPALPGSPVLIATLIVAFVALSWRRTRPVAALLLGFCWGVYWGQSMLDHLLPAQLERDEFVVTGTIIDIPDRDALRSRFTLAVEQCRHLKTGRLMPLQRIQISWYGNREPAAGDRWRLHVRLRRPRGFVNPGGVDYQAWLLRRGISATGYVIEGRDNKTLPPRRWNLARLRSELEQYVGRAASPEVAPLLSALTLGDRSGLDDHRWQVLRSTGTIHLMVVSGLHIGLIAGFCLLPGMLFGRILNRLRPGWTAQFTAAICSLSGATVYALLAGFALPAQRALIMLTSVVVAILIRRNATPWSGLLIALTLVLLMDPLAGWSPGFWLSFSAVAILLFVFSGSQRGTSRWRSMITAQLAIFAGLFALQLLLGNPVPLVGPLVNLVAIPWIGFLVLPLSLLGLALSALSPEFGGPVLNLASLLLQLLWTGLEKVAALTSAWQITLPGPGSWLLWSGLILATMLLLLPNALLVRGLALIPLSALFFVPRFSPPLTVVVLDVGQGLAVVVHAGSHTLVYDTGPTLGLKRDAGETVVAPYLSSKGVTRIDRLIVSHGESDHAGGVASLAARFPVGEVLAGQPEKLANKLDKRTNIQGCRAGQHWQWDRVSFEILSPQEEAKAARDGNVKNNNRSCVLMIHGNGVRILLPGDIESPVERALLAGDALDRPVDLLLAPHHGSKTSSSRAFVARLKPRNVVFSAGHKNRFGHPYPEVVERYRRVNSHLWDTADHGAVIFQWQFDPEEDTAQRAKLDVVPWRVQHRRYWF